MPDAIERWNGVENAVGILTMRLSTTGATRRMGESLLPEATTTQLLSYVATTALEILAQLERADV